MAIIGLVNIGLAFIPSSFAPYTMLTSWIDMSTVFVGGPLIIASMLMLVLAAGLILRFRTAWAFTICLLVLVAGVEFLFQGTIHIGIAGIVLAVWLFFKRPAFDRPFSLGSLQPYTDDALGHARTRIDAARARAQNRRAPRSGATQDLGTTTGWEQQAEEGQMVSGKAHEEGMLQPSKNGAGDDAPCAAGPAGIVLPASRPEGREG